MFATPLCWFRKCHYALTDQRRRCRFPAPEYVVVLALLIRRLNGICWLYHSGGASFGWTVYVPFQCNIFTGIGADLWLVGLAIGGIGTILGGVNLLRQFLRCAPLV